MFAYLDAATGSMIAAAIAGGAAGVGVLFRMYWHRLLGVFSSKHREVAEQAAAELSGHQEESDPLTPAS
jgi:hypothetical protein